MKPATPAMPRNPVTASNAATAIRVLKTATCPSLSGKSKLTFQIGCMGKSEIHFRVSANTGHGFFSDEWVALADIQEAMDKAPRGEPITSFILLPLFRGKSINTPCFLFAALKGEGLVQASKDKQRCYERVDSKEFMSGVKALIALDGDGKAKPPKAEAKPAAKPVSQSKPAAPAKKTPSKPTAKKK